MPPTLKLMKTDPVLRVYLRRSKGDGDHQQFSLDVQRDGARLFNERMCLGDWSRRVEYVDDDRAGDDFVGRADLRRLMADVRQGDPIITRDQSRLGRDAVEVTFLVRQLVQSQRGRLFYYSTGQEVPFATAIDSAMVFVQGTGHQLELEAIRSRTREALRARVRAGRIAGGRCYGYSLQRMKDSAGREYTIAAVDPEQAKIVQRVFEEYLQGAGLKVIARGLNSDRIPSPHAGRRGTGTWSPSAIHTMLRNERYRGVYTHGKYIRRRVGGKRVKEAAAASEIIRVEIPEWQIIGEDAWCAAQAKAAEKTRTATGRRAFAPGARYALAGLAKCETCGGGIGVANTKAAAKVSDENGRARAYACTYHITRGPEVCDVRIRQPIVEVEGPLVEWLQENVLSDVAMSAALQTIKEEVERLKKKQPKLDDVESELARLRTEQKRLAAAIATAGDIAELATELKKRSERIRSLEAELRAAKRSPEMMADALRQVEKEARARLRDLRAALRDPEQLREALQVVLPEGLTFSPVYLEPKTPTPRGGRPRGGVWRIRGKASLKGVFSTCVVTPPGIEPGIAT